MLQEQVGQLKEERADRLTEIRRLGAGGQQHFGSNGLKRRDGPPVCRYRIVMFSERLEQAARLPVPAIERFGCDRLLGRHHGPPREVQGFLVPPLRFIEGAKIAPGIGCCARIFDRRGDLHRFIEGLESLQHQRTVGVRETRTKVLVCQADADQAIGLVIRIIQSPHLLQSLIELVFALLMSAALLRCCCSVDKRV